MNVPVRMKIEHRGVSEFLSFRSPREALVVMTELPADAIVSVLNDEASTEPRSGVYAYRHAGSPRYIYGSRARALKALKMK